jgi:DNA-binding LytR/AlgR family response regulator
MLLVCTLAGLFLAFIAPFGTADAGIGMRLLYWVGIVNIGGLLGWGIGLLVLKWRRLEGRRWLQALTVALLMTPPAILVVWAWSRLLLPDVSLASPVDYALPVLVISLAMSAINALAASQPGQATTQTEAAVRPPASSRFLTRLPERLRGSDLYAVQAEDHYLRLHTSRGSDLILCRLADAVAELEGLDGLQTHRSWWVAREAVTAVAKADGRAVLTLASGAEAPVSRTALPKLREQGWL